MKETPSSRIEAYIVSEIEKYEDKQDEASQYSHNIEGYIDLLREVESQIEDLKKCKEDILKFENKNKI